MFTHHLLILISGLVQLRYGVSQCIADSDLNTEFARKINGDDDSTTYSIDGSCCMETICGLPCPQEVEPPTAGKFV